MTSRKELYAALLLAAALRLGFAFHAVPGPQPGGSRDYEPLALNLLETGVFSTEPGVPTAEREPGYVLFITGIYRLFGIHPWAVVLIQIGLSLATIVLARGLALAWFGPFPARFAAWACAAYPYFIYYSGYYFRETPLAFLLTASFWVLSRARGPRGIAAAGALAGAAAMANTALGPTLGVLALAVGRLAPRGERLRRGAAFLVPVALMMGLWIGRNWRVFGTFLPTSTLVGIQMYWAFAVPYEFLGTPEQTRILGGPGDDTEFQRLSGLPEIERNRAFFRAAVGLAAKDPLKAVRDGLRRAAGLWRPVPYERPHASHSYSLIRALALLSDGWLLPLTALGLWRARSNPQARLIALTLGMITLTYSISHAPIRYRVSFMPLALMLAGVGAEGLLAAWRSRKR